MIENDLTSWYQDEVVVWSNPVDENGESHADSRCDCYYAHPVCYHCDFIPPACHKLIHTRFLDDSAIYLQGKPYLVLFCDVCFAEREAHYNIVPKTEYDAYDAFVWMSAWYQSQHGSVRAPVPAPPPTPVAVYNPEDDYVGFDFESPAEDAAWLDLSAIPHVPDYATDDPK